MRRDSDSAAPARLRTMIQPIVSLSPERGGAFWMPMKAAMKRMRQAMRLIRRYRWRTRDRRTEGAPHPAQA
jgi:hypothetical protein